MRHASIQTTIRVSTPLYFHPANNPMSIVAPVTIGIQIRSRSVLNSCTSSSRVRVRRSIVCTIWRFADSTLAATPPSLSVSSRRAPISCFWYFPSQ
jgi:hypothetical protein